MLEVEHPERVVVSPSGGAAAFVVGRRSDGLATATGVWWGRLTERPARIDAEVPSTNLAFSPDGSQLAFGVQDDDGSRVRIVVAGAPESAPSTAETFALPGYVEALDWTSGDLLALAADPGADAASLTSGRPLPGADDDPRVIADGIGMRRLWRVGGDDEPTSIAGGEMTIWEFAVVPGGGVVAICSDDPREDGWYRPYVVHLPAEAGHPPRLLHRSDWQLASAVVDPRGEQVAFVEGWASDRGLLAGDVRVLALNDPGATTRALDALIDVTWLSWGDDGRLWLAGWDHLGTAWGWFEDAASGARPVLHRDAAGCVNSSWHPEVVPLGEGDSLTIRSTAGSPPEVVRVSPESAPTAWSALNDGVGDRGLEVQEVYWEGEDGLEIEGLLVRPPGSEQAHAPRLIVDIHGGPSIAFHHSWSMTWAEVLASAGWAVLMPNPRGSVGRGQAFGRLNHGDPGGAELRDVIAGVRHCISAGLVADGLAGAIGASYGGYLTAWAVTRADVFACGVVIAGVTDLLSSRGTANNNAFYDFLIQGPPNTVGAEYLSGSPVAAIDAQTVPTLILHGEQDQCVPLGQAHELHYALRAAGVATEMVVYPREGHQTREPAHIDDQRRRVIAWFERYLPGS